MGQTAAGGKTARIAAQGTGRMAGGFLAGLGVGAALGYMVRLSTRVTATIMAFGCGVLISAVAYDLVEEGYAIASFRPIAIGKKNWLFAGSARAGRRAAAIQSLLATAKLSGIDPARWLTDTLERLPMCLNSEIDSLLPLVNFTQD